MHLPIRVLETRKILRFLAACGVGVVAASCGSDKPSRGSRATSATSPTLQQVSNSKDAMLELDSGNVVVALGRLDDGTTLISTTAGVGYRVDGDAIEGITSAQRSEGDVQVFLVSADVIWFMYPNDGFVGRSKGGNANKLDVNKAAFDEVVTDAAKLTPITVTEEHLFWATDAALVVFTFRGDALNLRAIPLPDGKLESGERILGAGALEEDAEGVWLMTDRRVAATFDPSKSAKPTLFMTAAAAAV